MADEQPSSYDGGEGGDAPDTPEYDDHTTTAVGGDATTVVADDDYVDEPIEDYVVNLVVNEQPDGATLSPDLVNAVITDINGNVIGTQPSLYDKINGYTTNAYDQLNGTDTGITGSKGLFGWSTLKLILVGLAALCILALILGILFFIFGKKFKKNKRSTPAGTTTTTKAVVNKGISPDPKYQPVPNV